MNDLGETERDHPQGAQLDRLSTQALVAALVDDQRAAVEAVHRQTSEIAEIVEAIADRLRRGGRLRYVGAGSSGRIAALDAAEMPPTFGTAPTLVQASVAGGPTALTRSVEGAEDDAQAGAAAVADVGCDDAVIGLSASGEAPFVVAALAQARARGAYAVAIVNVEVGALHAVADRVVVLRSGAEVLAGSTRLKAGTAQKVALNAISTAIMVRLGRVYGNMMVDLVASNRKLQARAIRLVRRLTDADESGARRLLEAADGRVKVAVVMSSRGVDAPTAARMLEASGGRLREVLEG